MPRYYNVFLSHASTDKPAVEHLARKLREAGIEPFLDKWHLVPGEPWQEGIEEALGKVAPAPCLSARSSAHGRTRRCAPR